MNLQRLDAHLNVRQYGAFTLTDAISPSPDLGVVPHEGYRLDVYPLPCPCGCSGAVVVPVLIAAVSRERLFEVFLEFLDPLGDVVDAVLETSHDCDDDGHKDLCREGIDMPVLQSAFYDFEDVLLHDGCTGVAVMSHDPPAEVQFDEHKVLLVYAHNLTPFVEILHRRGISPNDGMRFITDGPHLHSTDPRRHASFEQFCQRLGAHEAPEMMRPW